MNAEHNMQLSDSSPATAYRAIVARLNYLGQDSEIQFAVKELGRDMNKPTQARWTKTKRVLRYLKGVPHAILHFKYQARPKSLVVWSDSDFAGCTRTRKSTSAGVLMFGNHMWKSWSTNQAVIALSSGEAKYYALVKAGSIGLGAQAIAREMGIGFDNPIELNSGVSAVIGISSRVGSGKVRHIEVTQLWLQDKVSSKEVVLIKVGTDESLDDALTKGVDASNIASHATGVMMELRSDWHRLAPTLESDASAELRMEGE